ncbi:hypothetical protein LTR37_013631 [Vermiconidia calcicola]|uniref:Uncharacterized protein n=1 Tax=Vermiconidia calcicola TaxID=1690605 RepID=A0ACC3MVW1_9PEZI|nr:hypothetical protein LTR37_013631 [Vermiconidia calcicola]
MTTLLTILQLATIEEFLGDWGNLLGHQRAAHQILTDSFTPQTIMQDETRRKIITWYIRFDLFAGMMSGSETNLSREWFAACHEHYQRQAKDRPDDLGAKYEEFFSRSRLVATDVTLLFSQKGRGAISDEDFALKTEALIARVDADRIRVETAFTDSTNFIKRFPRQSKTNAKAITEYWDPEFLYGGELFTMNYVLIDFWAIDLMFKHNLAKVQGQQPTPEMTRIALRKCKMFEAIEHCDQGAAGAILGCQASLGIACLFLPKDEIHTDWCRRKFALIEQTGYLYPPRIRFHMSQVWNVDVSHWWLAHDEGYPDIVRAIRDFIDYRANAPKDALDADVRDMSGIFKAMKISERDDVTGTDSEQFSPIPDQSTSHESSPDPTWPA